MDNQKRVILVTEDEKNLSDILTDKLHTEGYEVITAGDGEQGLKLALERKPDLVILDIVMPKMNGMQVLAKLREDEWGKGVKVICLTNKQLDSEVADNLGKYSPMYYLLKAESSLEEIVEMVKNALKSK